MNNEQSKENMEIYRQFAADFADTIIAQNFNAAQNFFAPWLQTEVSSDDFRADLENELWAANAAWEIEELIYPEKFTISSNSSSVADLKQYESPNPPKLSDEMTDENFRQWMVIQFLPDEDDERIEFDAWFDFWLAIVEINGELKIGYYEFTEPD